jgi:hypothetical protein
LLTHRAEVAAHAAGSLGRLEDRRGPLGQPGHQRQQQLDQLDPSSVRRSSTGGGMIGRPARLHQAVTFECLQGLGEDLLADSSTERRTTPSGKNARRGLIVEGRWPRSATAARVSA